MIVDLTEVNKTYLPTLLLSYNHTSTLPDSDAHGTIITGPTRTPNTHQQARCGVRHGMHHALPPQFHAHAALLAAFLTHSDPISQHMPPRRRKYYRSDAGNNATMPRTPASTSAGILRPSLLLSATAAALLCCCRWTFWSEAALRQAEAAVSVEATMPTHAAPACCAAELRQPPGWCCMAGSVPRACSIQLPGLCRPEPASESLRVLEVTPLCDLRLRHI